MKYSSKIGAQLKIKKKPRARGFAESTSVCVAGTVRVPRAARGCSLRLQRAAPLFMAVIVVAASTGCTHRSAQGATVALDPDQDDGLGGTGIESGDVRAAADQIARALLKDNRPTKIAILPVENHTSFRVDAGLVHEERRARTHLQPPGAEAVGVVVLARRQGRAVELAQP